jgi:hypothetical protein
MRTIESATLRGVSSEIDTRMTAIIRLTGGRWRGQTSASDSGLEDDMSLTDGTEVRANAYTSSLAPSPLPKSTCLCGLLGQLTGSR